MRAIPAPARSSADAALITVLVAVIAGVAVLNVLAMQGAFQEPTKPALEVPRAAPKAPPAETEVRAAPGPRVQAPSAPAGKRAPRPVLTKPASTPRPELPRFAGKHFSIDYPHGWRIATAEAPIRTYLDTTILHPDTPWAYVRVDVTPRRGGTPAAHAASVERHLARQDGYRRVGLATAKLAGLPAVRWEFQVRERGVLLHKVDVFLTDRRGNRIAVLTQAPASAYERHEALFARVRSSFATAPE
jgi:hypothetical protein